MSDREDMVALANECQFVGSGKTGCNPYQLLCRAADALRSAARTGPDVAGFEACREAAIAIARQAGEPYALNANTGAMMFRAVTEKIAAAIAALPAPATASEGWQPIETARKDGTAIIGAFWSIRWADSHRKGDIVRCWYQPEFEAFISSCREMTLAPGLTFENGSSRELHSPVIEPVTHWMPLPPAPTITRKSESEEAGS